MKSAGIAHVMLAPRLRAVELRPRPADFALRVQGWPAHLVKLCPEYLDRGDASTHARGSAK